MNKPILDPCCGPKKKGDGVEMRDTMAGTTGQPIEVAILRAVRNILEVDGLATVDIHIHAEPMSIPTVKAEMVIYALKG